MAAKSKKVSNEVVDIYKTYSIKRICYMIFITAFALSILFSALAISYSGRLFHNTSYVDSVTGEGVVKMAAYQYFTYFSFTVVTFYYVLLTFLATLSYYLKKDVKFFDKVSSPFVKNFFIYAYVTMFVMVVFLLGPYSFWYYLTETTPAGGDPSADAGSTLAPKILTIIIHIFVPTFVFIEHFTYAPYKEIKRSGFLWWNIPAFVYIAYSIPVGAAQSANLGFSIYPYFFIDPEIMTWGGVVGVLIGLFIVSFFATYTLQWIQTRQYLKGQESLEKNAYSPISDTLDLMEGVFRKKTK